MNSACPKRRPEQAFERWAFQRPSITSVLEERGRYDDPAGVRPVVLQLWAHPSLSRVSESDEYVVKPADLETPKSENIPKELK